jgi:hypothetical protein
MDYTPALVQLENHVAGDTWQGIPVIGPILINALQPGVAAQRVEMSLSRTPTGPSFQFDTEAADGVLPITIVDADTWEFMVPPVGFDDFTVTPGKYEGHLAITDAAGERLTTHELRMTVLHNK